MRKADFVTAVMCLVGGGFMLYESMNLDLFVASGQTGPGFFPATLSAMLILLGVLLAITAARRREPEEQSAAASLATVRRPLAIWVLLVVSVLLLELVGFIVSMALFMAGLTLGLERRPLVGSIVASVLVPVLLFFVFGTLLGVRLPGLD